MRGRINKPTQSWPIEIARLSDLKPPRRNARTHSKKQIRQIANSILRFGWTYPILTDESKHIIAGIGRSKAAEQLGLRDVPVIVMTGLSDAEKRALALADNKIAANAGWDRKLLDWANSRFCYPNATSTLRSPASNPPKSTAWWVILSIASMIRRTKCLCLQASRSAVLAICGCLAHIACSAPMQGRPVMSAS
jgi:hypothetical protein